jgi:FlaG/FlaF family flagellin (archaellin)
MKVKNQSGFTAVEGLLIIIALAIVGFTGFYVYHSSKKVDQTNASSTSGNTKTTTPAVRYQAFQSLGVKIKLVGTAKQFQYSEDQGSVSVKSSALKALTDKVCAKDSGGDGTVLAVSRVEGTFDQSNNPGTGLVKQYTGFALTEASPNGFVCGTTDQATHQVSDKQSQLAKQVTLIFKGAQPLQ